MEKWELDEKITGASKTILSYCMAHTSTSYDAEDLAQEIILEIYKSSADIRDDRAFYGFLWAVAKNVYRQWCRRNKRDSYCELPETIAAEEDYILDRLEEDSDIALLRRELTLLVEKYRRAVILYYLEDYSCIQIARKLSVSESMVKYLLFKSRQIVKDGMNMERKLGEQSYNPKKLSIMFWGEYNRYSHVCDSRIAQNILFACYNDKLTAEQISLEIGVALPYMEDDLYQLTEYGLLERDGSRYFTNIVIFTKEFDREADIKTLKSVQQIADKVKSALDEKEPEIRKIGFYGADMEQNSFAWQISCILLHYAIIEKLQNRVKLQYPVDKFGQACFVWGQERYEDERDAGSFRFGHCEVSNQRGDRIFFMDFGINGEFLHHIFFNRQDYTNVLLELAEGRTDGFGENDRTVLADLVKRGIAGNSSGKLCLNMPVFTVDQMKRLEGIFEPVSDEIAAEAGNLMEEIRAILKNHVPTHLKKTAKDLAYFRILENCISKPIEKLNREKYLLPAPDGAMLPTTYVLISGKSISE